MKPDYLAQTGECRTAVERDAWIKARVDEAKAEGCRHGRMSYDEEHNLYLVEAWKERPDDEGEPRFQFAAPPNQ